MLQVEEQAADRPEYPGVEIRRNLVDDLANQLPRPGTGQMFVFLTNVLPADENDATFGPALQTLLTDMYMWAS